MRSKSKQNISDFYGQMDEWLITATSLSTRKLL